MNGSQTDLIHNLRLYSFLIHHTLEIEHRGYNDYKCNSFKLILTNPNL